MLRIMTGRDDNGCHRVPAPQIAGARSALLHVAAGLFDERLSGMQQGNYNIWCQVDVLRLTKRAALGNSMTLPALRLKR